MLLLCLRIFFIRILDVSLGTLRTILVIKDKRLLASVTGFIEIAIWFTVVRAALITTQESIWIIIAYAGGFATGTYIGSFLSEKFIEGNLTVQIITDKQEKLVNALRDKGYGVSVIDIKGKDKDQPKNILFIEITKKRFTHLRNMVKAIDGKAFIIVNETKYVQNGYIK